MQWLSSTTSPSHPLHVYITEHFLPHRIYYPSPFFLLVSWLILNQWEMNLIFSPFPSGKNLFRFFLSFMPRQIEIRKMLNCRLNEAIPPPNQWHFYSNGPLYFSITGFQRGCSLAFSPTKGPRYLNGKHTKQHSMRSAAGLASFSSIETLTMEPLFIHP